MANKANSLKPHQLALIAAGVASLVIWAAPALHLALLPLQYLNTHIHELCHALVCEATAGQVDHIEVHAAGDGVTPIRGGNLLLEVSAGYVGATIIGTLILLFGRSERGAKGTLRVLSIALAVSMLIWVRADSVGIVAGVGWIAAIWAISTFLKGANLLFATQFIGLQQCLNAVQSLYILLELSAFTGVHSDAKIMEQASSIPAVAWAIGWCGFSLLMMFLGLKQAWKTPSTKPLP